jgi:hypothetical protein
VSVAECNTWSRLADVSVNGKGIIPGVIAAGAVLIETSALRKHIALPQSIFAVSFLFSKAKGKKVKGL